jgi:polysaccharide biosynthesis protein PslH
MPALTGNGLAMRAGTVLRALADRHRVSLLVATRYAPSGAAVPPEIASRCHQIVVLPPRPELPESSSFRPAAFLGRLTRSLTRRRPRAQPGVPSKAAFVDAPFDVVHVFRLAALPHARSWLGQAGDRPQLHLDLDDVESTTHRRLADLYRQNGDLRRAQHEEVEAERYAVLEAEVQGLFDRLYVCSEVDRARLGERPGARVCVLPNGLPLPARFPPKTGGGRFTFLFVGTLGYYPNEDALVHFCRDVLPLIRQIAGREICLVIVGSGGSPATQALATMPEIRLVGTVPDVAPWYRDADAVVAPIRAGGGTRIKILEAFSFRRPVVSTSLGVEGIDAQHEEHLLIGDTPDALARQCARLIAEPRLAEALAERAFDLFRCAYSTEAVTRALDALA